MAGQLSEDPLNGNADDCDEPDDHFQLVSPAEVALNGSGAYSSEICSAGGQDGVSVISRQRRSELMTGNCHRHRPLSLFRVVRGVICLTVLLSTAFMMLIYLGVVTAVLLRLFSVHYSRKVTSFFFGKWLALWPSLFEKLNQTKVIWYGDTVPPQERVVLLCNHKTEVDWMYLWNFAIRKGRLGYIKYILKRSLMRLPIFGWGFHILEFIPVQRKWESDEQLMHQMLTTFVDPQDPLWLVVFPEGTDYTEQKCIRSQKFAKEKGLPVLEHLLLPKTKGVTACLEILRNSLDAVYDVTIAYKYRCPSFMDNVLGVDPSEVHLHVCRIPLNEIPTSEPEAASWLMNRFQQKDDLLSDFHSKGSFPQQTLEHELSTFRCLANLAFVITLTSIFTVLTYFSPWFRLYVTLSCAFLTSVTYFNIRPKPLFGHKKF